MKSAAPAAAHASDTCSSDTSAGSPMSLGSAAYSISCPATALGSAPDGTGTSPRKVAANLLRTLAPPTFPAWERRRAPSVRHDAHSCSRHDTAAQLGGTEWLGVEP